MYSSSREEVVGVFDAFEADLDRALQLSFDALTTPSTAAEPISARQSSRRAEMAALSYARARCSGYGTASARPHYAHAMAETSYAKCGDLSLAYQVFGDGPLELVVVGPFVSHIELAWTLPQFKGFLGAPPRVLPRLFVHKGGGGFSGPGPKVPPAG